MNSSFFSRRATTFIRNVQGKSDLLAVRSRIPTSRSMSGFSPFKGMPDKFKGPLCGAIIGGIVFTHSINYCSTMVKRIEDFENGTFNPKLVKEYNHEDIRKLKFLMLGEDPDDDDEDEEDEEEEEEEAEQEEEVEEEDEDTSEGSSDEQICQETEKESEEEIEAENTSNESGDEESESVEAPVESVEVAPVESVEVAPAESVEVAPAESVEVAPAESVEVAPAESVEVAPVESVEVAPAESVEVSAESVEVAPVESVEVSAESVVASKETVEFTESSAAQEAIPVNYVPEKGETVDVKEYGKDVVLFVGKENSA